MRYVTFDKEKYMKFQKAYNEANKGYKSSFTFEGDLYFTGYAKYMVEALKNTFDKQK